MRERRARLRSCRLLLSFFDDGTLKPRHLGAQRLADGFDGMVEVALLERAVAAVAGRVLGDPLAREAAGADLLQDLLHALARFAVDHARAAREVAELRGLADELVHLREAAFV